MRIVLKLACYVAAIAALYWLLVQIGVGFHRAADTGNSSGTSRTWLHFALYLLASAVLAVLLAWDVSRCLGSLVGQLFWSGGRIASLTPVWWKAERLCRDGRPLDAIRGLRDCLESHPKHWGPAVRIAEIYERELKDQLSASLEYEALLQRKLPKSARAEVLLRLAACHLLRHRTSDCIARLQQVSVEFRGTGAARKAHRRLARLEIR